MALEADRTGSRADTFLFLACVSLSLVAMALGAAVLARGRLRRRA